MAVQKSKKTRSRRGMRRSHDSIILKNVSVEKNSGIEHMYHHVTPCGLYKGEQIIDIKKKKKRD